MEAPSSSAKPSSQSPTAARVPPEAHSPSLRVVVEADHVEVPPSHRPRLDRGAVVVVVDSGASAALALPPEVLGAIAALGADVPGVLRLIFAPSIECEGANARGG
mmetsp:Transcript_64109/g.177212  ORF Transcript_64109/g.177212 Transcript_64109/m.177212 type:complete len:105 (+) Transcript_64109:603-917(+)